MNNYYKISAAQQMNYIHRASVTDKRTSLCGPGMPPPAPFYSEEQVHSSLKALRETTKIQLSWTTIIPI